MKRNKFIIIILILIYSCNQNQADDQEIKRLITSNNPDEIIKGFDLIGFKNEDSIYLPYIFDNIYNPHVTTIIQRKGVSVYEIKIISLGRYFKVNPPKKLLPIPDTSIVHFYFKLALDKGYKFSDSIYKEVGYLKQDSI